MLKQRVITAVILIAILLSAILWLPALYFDGLLVCVVVVASWEWTTLSAVRPTALRVAYVASMLAVGALVLKFSAGSQSALFTAGLLWWLVALVCLLRHPKPNWLLRQSWFLLVVGYCVLIPSWFGFHYLQQLPGRIFYLLWFIALVAAADIGAYFAGRTLGKHKLAPAVSPNKTIEGLLGGIVATVAVAELGVMLGVQSVLNHWLVVGAAVILAILSVVGDLFESLLKRQQQLKDSGTLLPGHGGVMDRLDSITAALPLYVLFVQCLVLYA